MKIGLIVAIETDALEYYGVLEKLECPSGYELFYKNKQGNEMFILKTGMGVAAAAAGTQYLITKYKVEKIINFGVVGGLTDEMCKQKECIVDKAVHYRYDLTEGFDLVHGQVYGHESIYLPTDREMLNMVKKIVPEIKVVNCASGDKFVATADEKRLIHEKFNADICDMESSAIVLTCEANNIPCMLIKAVSDGLLDGANGFYEELKSAGTLALKIVDKVLQNI